MKPITKQSITKMMEEELANMQATPRSITKNKIKKMMEEELANMKENEFAGMGYSDDAEEEHEQVAIEKKNMMMSIEELLIHVSPKEVSRLLQDLAAQVEQGRIQEGLSEARKRPLKRHRDAFDKNTQMVSDLQKTISSFLKENGAKLNKNHMSAIETMSTRLMHIANSPMIKLSEGDANSRMISSLEKIGEEIKGIAHMSVDPAILERLEFVEEMIQQLWQDMMGVQ